MMAQQAPSPIRDGQRAPGWFVYCAHCGQVFGPLWSTAAAQRATVCDPCAYAEDAAAL
jgi:hypothetical protein